MEGLKWRRKMWIISKNVKKAKKWKKPKKAAKPWKTLDFLKMKSEKLSFLVIRKNEEKAGHLRPAFFFVQIEFNFWTPVKAEKWEFWRFVKSLLKIASSVYCWIEELFAKWQNISSAIGKPCNYWIRRESGIDCGTNIAELVYCKFTYFNSPYKLCIKNE